MSAAFVLGPLIMISWIVAATAASAEVVKLSGSAIRTTLTGSILELDTPLGTTIPVRFSADGLVSGEASGSVASYLGAERDRGRWWVDSDRLCVKWFKWFDAEPRCLSLRQQGARIFWRAQDGQKGTATITVQMPVAQPVQQVAKREAPPVDPQPVANVASLPPQPESLSRPRPAERQETFELADLPPVPAPAPSWKTESRTVAASPAPVAAPPPAEIRRAEPAQAASRETAPQERVVARASASSFAAQRAMPSSPSPVSVRSAAPPIERKTFRVARVDMDDVLNVRDGPSEYTTPIGSIAPGGRGIRIVGPCRGSWCPIRHGRMSGWVNAYYLAPEFPEAATLARSE